MTRYLVTDEQLRDAIDSAIRSLDIDPQDDNYIIESTVKVSDKVLNSLAVSKIAESVQIENSKQDARRETDTSEYPVIRLEDIKAADLVDIICHAYRNGLAD